jgi:proteasome lid subunit RPN8/RPN11
VGQARPVANVWDDRPELRRAILEGRSAAGPSVAEWEAHSQERRFLIDPRDYAAIDREAQAAGHEIIGFYHSHPDHPAAPSPFDRDMAFPDQSYLIVSVRAGQAAELRSWHVPDWDAPFVEESVLRE